MHVEDTSSLAVSGTHAMTLSWPDPLDAVSPSKGAVCHAYILRERTARRQRSLRPFSASRLSPPRNEGVGIEGGLVLVLEAVRCSSADRPYRRQSQKATLDDLEHQDQVGLPATEVGW
jgi:hypothetical protein